MSVFDLDEKDEDLIHSWQISTDNQSFTCSFCGLLLINSYQINSCGCKICGWCFHHNNYLNSLLQCKNHPDTVLDIEENIYVDKAKQRDVKKVILPCPNCGVNYDLPSLLKHLANCGTVNSIVVLDSECKKCQNCLYCGEGGLTNPVLTNDHKMLCPNWPYECPYNLVGCNIHFSDLKHHLHSEKGHHLRLLLQFKEESMSQINVLRSDLQVKQSKMYSLLDRNIALFRDYQFHSLSESVEQKYQGGGFESLDVELPLRIGRKLCHSVECNNGEGSFCWKIQNVDRLLGEMYTPANNGVVFSDYFYTDHPVGYRMRFALIEKSAHNFHNRKYHFGLQLGCGKYDDFLNFPLRARFKFSIVRKHHVDVCSDVFQIDKSNAHFFQRTTTENRPFVMKTVSQLDELVVRTDNSLFLMLTVVHHFSTQFIK